MKISISSTGTPSHVKTDLSNQLDRLGREGKPEHWPALATLRDSIAHEVNGEDPEQELSVTASIEVSVRRSEPKKAGSAKAQGAEGK